jgi:predicted O-methyltransferase YrrM
VSGTENGKKPRVLNWSSDVSFTLGATAFRLATFAARPSEPDRFALAKPKWMLQEYLDLAPEFTGGRIVELGIAEGGSTAFFAELLQPSMLLAMEIVDQPNPALAEFIATRGYDATVHTAYGIDQADRSRVEAHLHAHFGAGPLDLVVDDASHLLQPTLASFAVLFPRLRPGGVFILEDWSHDHTWERVVRSDPGQFDPDVVARFEGMPAEQRDLSRLLLDLTLTVGYMPDVVSEIRVRNGFAMVRRGDAILDPDTFDIAECYGPIGRALLRTKPG